MRIGLFLKYDREIVKWSENREIPDLWAELTGMILFLSNYITLRIQRLVSHFEPPHLNLLCLQVQLFFFFLLF